MLDYIIVLLLAALLFLTLFLVVLKGVHLNINLVMTQQLSDEDRHLLEDLYNTQGDPKDNKLLPDELYDVVKSVNDIMLGSDEENSNG